MHRSHDQWASEEWGAHVRFTANFLSALSLRPRQVTPVVVRCALAGAGARKASPRMRPGDSDRAAHGANDIRSGPDPRVRDSGSPADCAAGRSAYLARKNSWQGQRTGSARRDVRLQTQRSGGILRRSIRPSHKACEWAKYRFSESPNRRNDICQQYDNDRRHDQPSRRSHNTSKQLAKHRRVSLGFSARGPSRSNITEKLLDR
jgi:hypothetical protein